MAYRKSVRSLQKSFQKDMSSSNVLQGVRRTDNSSNSRLSELETFFKDSPKNLRQGLTLLEPTYVFLSRDVVIRSGIPDRKYNELEDDLRNRFSRSIAQQPKAEVTDVFLTKHAPYLLGLTLKSDELLAERNRAINLVEEWAGRSLGLVLPKDPYLTVGIFKEHVFRDRREAIRQRTESWAQGAQIVFKSMEFEYAVAPHA